jgi:hypothetical protein
MKGIGMKGAFEASVKGITDGFAQIVEKGSYALDARRIASDLTLATNQAYPTLRIKLTPDPKAVWNTENVWWFGLDSGRVETMNVKGKFSIDTELTGNFRGEKHAVNCALERDMNLAVRWQALND